MKIFFEKVHTLRLCAGLLVFFLPGVTCAGSLDAQDVGIPELEPVETQASVSDDTKVPEDVALPSEDVTVGEGQETAKQGDEQQELFEEKGAVVEDSPFYEYIAGRLQIGSRSTYRSLRDADSGHKGEGFGSGTYLGTIYALDEKQNLAPFSPYLSWSFSDYLGIEFAYDHFEVKTVATNGYDMRDKTDGDLELSGLVVSLLARYPNKTRFTPWAGLGLFFYSTSFDPNPDWTHSKRIANAYNHMSVDDVNGVALSLGVDWKLEEHWILNLSCQYMSMDVDAVYKGYLNDVHYTTQPGQFPVNNISVRLGLGYQF